MSWPEGQLYGRADPQVGRKMLELGTVGADRQPCADPDGNPDECDTRQQMDNAISTVSAVLRKQIGVDE